MSQVFGTLATNDHERAFVIVQGQDLVMQVAQDWVADRVAEFFETTAIFVESKTESFKERYMKPGAGYMQRRGSQSQVGTQKANGSWDVAYPLEDFEVAIGWNDVDIAYMSAEVLSNHIVTGMNSYVNSYRHEILHRLFDNVQGTFTDPIHGSLTPEPLANGDTVTYPPVNGEPTSEATEDHYLGTAYTAANISGDNNPLETIRDDLDHHFGGPSTGGDSIAVYCNRAQRSKLESLPNFVEVPDNWVMVGDDADVPFGLPSSPGKILGRSDGVWVIQWDFIPANYLLGIDLEQAAPLKQRHDPMDTGLGDGSLQLVATDNQHPFETSFWRARFGIGAGNRLNGVAMFVGGTSSYTIPTAYD
jgi:hypothetical protein